MKHWIAAARPRTLPLALSGIVLGAVPSSIHEIHGGNGWVLFWIILTAVLLQVLSNFANDYGDTQNGADQHRTAGPARAVQSGVISPQQMKRAVGITAGLCLIAGIILLYVALLSQGLVWPFVLWLTIGLISIAAAYLYTAGKKPYGYWGGGDLAVFLFFGVVSIVGTHYLIFHRVSWDLWPAVLVSGGMATMVLNMNNMRDWKDDLKANKKTLAARLGFDMAKKYHSFLLLIVLLGFWKMADNYPFPVGVWLGLSAAMLMLSHGLRVKRATEEVVLDKELKRIALTSFAYSILYLTLASL